MLETNVRETVRIGPFEYAHLTFDRATRFDEHRHGRPHLIMLYSGSWIDSSPGARILLGPGEVLFHPAGFLHAARCPSAADLVLIAISVDVTRTFCPMYGNVARDVQLPFEAVRGLPDAIRQELLHRDAAASFIIESLTMQLLALGSRVCSAGSGPPPTWLSAAVMYINESVAAPLTVRSVAVHVGVSPSRLAHVFRSVMGRPVAAYIRECRVRAAARALRESADSIGDIALACGFYDQAHLSHAFKALRGTTPLQYRRAHRALPPPADSYKSGTLRQSSR